MKKLNLLFLVLIAMLSSCAGGNASIIGGATFTDYFPSIFMIIGSGIIAYGGYVFYTGWQIGSIDEIGDSKMKTGVFLAYVGAFVFVFGLLTYFL